MDKLDGLIKEFFDQYEEDQKKIDELHTHQEELVEKQEEKVREVAFKLLPVMEKFVDKGYRFGGSDTNYRSSRGPILKHDQRENKLYIFSVKDRCPIVVDLYNKESKSISYRSLLREVEFTQVMNNLLAVLNFFQEIKEELEKSNQDLAEELKRYEEI